MNTSQTPEGVFAVVDVSPLYAEMGGQVGDTGTLTIERDKTTYTWRGFRHTYGQKVRGQRTRSTGRTGMTVGVLRKSIMKAAGPAQAAQAQAQATAAAPAAGEAKKEVKPKEAPKKE